MCSKGLKDLIFHFMKIFSGHKKQIDMSLMNHLEKFDWEEGNVRDLKNVCEFLSISSRNDDTITTKHLPEQYSFCDNNLMELNSFSKIDTEKIFNSGYDQYIKCIEHSIFKELLKSESKIKPLAEKIKIDRMTLNRKLIKLNLK